MPTNPYDDILDRARTELNPQEQLRLIEELSQAAGMKNGPRSIAELRGLGKKIWQGVDADEYVRKERDSWGG